MQTIIHSTDFVLTKALETFIKQQVSKSMNVCSNQVERLVIRLKDINDPQHDKECSVEIILAHQAPIVVSKKNTNAYRSIKEALGRASRTVLRRSGKRQSNKHTRMEIDETI